LKERGKYVKLSFEKGNWVAVNLIMMEVFGK
jgi:hypothetical protein